VARSLEQSRAAAARCATTGDYESRESGCAARAGRGIRLGFGEWGKRRNLRLIYGGAPWLVGWAGQNSRWGTGLVAVLAYLSGRICGTLRPRHGLVPRAGPNPRAAGRANWLHGHI
jgi:hypothetical protein